MGLPVRGMVRLLLAKQLLMGLPVRGMVRLLMSMQLLMGCPMSRMLRLLRRSLHHDHRLPHAAADRHQQPHHSPHRQPHQQLHGEASLIPLTGSPMMGLPVSLTMVTGCPISSC